VIDMADSQRTALVTGAAGGIGRAIARTLASRGHRVAILDLDAAGLTETAASDGTFRPQVTDVTDAAAVRAAVDAVGEHWGPPHVVVNAAGISTMALLVDVTEDDWDATMAVNAKGTFLVMRAVLPAMIERRAGTIINIASVAGIEGATLLSHYAASKFAVVGLTQSAAKEVAGFGIRVNAVCPGLIRTPMQDREVIWEAELTGVTPAQIRQGYLDITPMARIGTPQDVARLVSFLASDESDFITGQSLHVDGGLRMR
jgi:meso-butanediol dehydrogenase / (S,S)-butanediol dehydrogenase / diacetyl reductase